MGVSRLACYDLTRFQQEPLEFAAVHPNGALPDADGRQLSVLDQLVAP